MNLTKVLGLLFLVFLFFSCATNKGVEDLGEIEDDKEPELVLTEKEVTQTIYYPVMEEKFYGNNQKDVIKKYEYNNDFLLVKLTETNEQGEILNTIIYEYDGRNLAKEVNYNFNNELTRTVIYKYNSKGQKIQDELFGKDGKSQSTNTYEYAGDNLVRWNTLGPNLSPLGVTEYVYNKDLLVKILIKDASGRTDGSINKSYEGDLLVQEEVLDKQGAMERRIEYIYTDRKLNEVIYFDSKNKIERKEGLSYVANNPNPIARTFYYKSGAIESYINIGYNSREEKRIILVEEYK